MRPLIKYIKAFAHRLVVIGGAAVLTLAFFLVLPLMQAINKPPTADTVVSSVDAYVEPPPPPPEPEPEEEEPEEEPPPPELAEETPPLDLSQLELALNPGFGGAGLVGDFATKLNNVASEGDDLNELFSMSDLDQKPRVMYQPSPTLNAQVRRKAPGTVYILFIVDKNGRVVKPKIQKSTDPVFEQPALAAVKQWKFDPGKRNGEPVRFRMRVPITFPEMR